MNNMSTFIQGLREQIGGHSSYPLHFNATFNPTSAWVIQQLREAFPFDTAPRHLIFDRKKGKGTYLTPYSGSTSTWPSGSAASKN